MVPRFNDDQISEIVSILKNDGVVSVPTDTVFGLCVRMNSAAAFQKLMRAKNRPHEKAFPVMCADLEQIKDIAIIDNDSADLINRYMPGPLTIVLRKQPGLPDYIEKETLAIRMATTDFLRSLITSLGEPIFLTSANQSGQPTCQTIDEIERQCPEIDGMVNGSIIFGEASTIVDCSDGSMKILRQGNLHLDKRS